ncbi:MAG: response regulator [Alphaproteobacteria bacterium]|nr:response regulator [Alphaproteobacteria bacterium]
MSKIMIVEDEADLITILEYNLQKAGYETAFVSDGRKALDVIVKERPDVVLLDWMLPHMTGIEICRAVRTHIDISETPVILLTARGEESDKVKGLSTGADDYVTKPFSIPELLARIKALLRRSPKKKKLEQLSFADITIDFEKRYVLRNGKIFFLWHR